MGVLTWRKLCFATGLASALLCAHGVVGAQAEANVLGLRVTPQAPAASANQTPPPPALGNKKTTITSKGKLGAPTATDPAIAPTGGVANVNDGQAKSAINGGVTMSSSYVDTRAVVVVTTNAQFTTPDAQKSALLAAQLIQRDLYLSCGRQCKPAAMDKAKILPDGKLQFPLAVDGLGRVLANDDMVNMVLGKSLAVLATTLAKPAPTAHAASAASTAPAAPAAPAASTAPSTAP